MVAGSYNPIQIVFQNSNSLDELNLWTPLPSNIDQDYYSVASHTLMESERPFILYFLYLLQMEIMEQSWKLSLTNFIFLINISRRKVNVFMPTSFIEPQFPKVEAAIYSQKK